MPPVVAVTDEQRLKNNREQVRALMADGAYHTAPSIRAVGGSEGLRRMRELRVGREYQKLNLGNGLFAYRIVGL